MGQMDFQPLHMPGGCIRESNATELPRAAPDLSEGPKTRTGIQSCSVSRGFYIEGTYAFCRALAPLTSTTLCRQWHAMTE